MNTPKSNNHSQETESGSRISDGVANHSKSQDGQNISDEVLKEKILKMPDKRKCGNCTKLKKKIAELEAMLEIYNKINTAKAISRSRTAEHLASLMTTQKSEGEE